MLFIEIQNGWLSPPMTCVVVAPRALTSITQKAGLGEEVVVCN